MSVSQRKVAKVKPYSGPAGGWGSVGALGSILTQEEVAVLGSEILLKQNKPGGYMCVSCSWAKPAKPHPFEFCENGAKATTWEITHKRVTPEFFSERTVTELESWDDHQLESAGRLTHPMRYNAASDKYIPVSWQEVFTDIGNELRPLDPDSVVFYTSGRADTPSVGTISPYAIVIERDTDNYKSSADLKSWSLYGNMDYAFADAWHLSLGARLTNDKKTFVNLSNVQYYFNGTPISIPGQAESGPRAFALRVERLEEVHLHVGIDP